MKRRNTHVLRAHVYICIGTRATGEHVALEKSRAARIPEHWICMTMPNQVGQISARGWEGGKSTEEDDEYVMMFQERGSPVLSPAQVRSIPVFIHEWRLEGVAFSPSNLFLRHSRPRWILYTHTYTNNVHFHLTSSIRFSPLYRTSFLSSSRLLFHGNVIYMPPFGRSKGETFDPHSVPMRAKLVQRKIYNFRSRREELKNLMGNVQDAGHDIIMIYMSRI